MVTKFQQSTTKLFMPTVTIPIIYLFQFSFLFGTLGILSLLFGVFLALGLYLWIILLGLF